MEYRVACECGESVTVTVTAAGSKVPCSCGRIVDIPSLRQLRRMAGEAETSLPPELAVEALLLAGKLPEENHCVVCGIPTQDTAYFRAECERAVVKPVRWSGLNLFVAFLVFGWIEMLIAWANPREYKEQGKDRIFTLPLRVCATCKPGLIVPKAMEAALRRVDLYQRLLDKFPNTFVTFTQP